MKKIVLNRMTIMLLLLTAALSVGCSSKETVTSEQTIKRVSTLTATVEAKDETIMYLGTIRPEDVKGYAFKSPGKVGTVHVEVGDTVEVGDVLVTLDTTDLDFQLSSAKWQMATAEAQYNQVLSGAAYEEIKMLELSKSLASEAYDLASEQAEKVKALYEAGYASETEYKQVKLNALNAQTSLGQVEQQLQQAVNGASQDNVAMAMSQYELAKVQFDAAQSLFDDAVITATVSGVVVDVPYEIGTLIDAGMPVVITRGKDSYVQLGLTQKDIHLISIGQEAEITFGPQTYKGHVTFIDEFADQTLGTFRVEVKTDGNDLTNIPYGGITEVTFTVNQEDGIWVPLSAVLNEGIDYVYVNEGGYAIKRRIDRLALNNNMVMVDGLMEGDKVIVEGILTINEGDQIVESEEVESGGAANE